MAPVFGWLCGWSPAISHHINASEAALFSGECGTQIIYAGVECVARS